MRWLLAILEALAALSAAYAEPPRYTVTNRTTAQPAFVVTNKTAPKANPPRCTCEAGNCRCIPDFGGMGRCGCFPDIPRANPTVAPLPAVPYADVYARVSRGERIIALVNLPAADRQGPVVPAPAGWVAVRCDDIPETPPGRWKLFLDSAGRFMMEEITTYAATASGVAVQNRPFRASRSTPVTVASSAGTNATPTPTGSAGPVQWQVPIYTRALGAGRSGGIVTNCTSYG